MKTQTPTSSEVARRAYQIYEQTGCQAGHELDAWLQAQRELRAKLPPDGKKKRRPVSTTEIEAGTNPWEQPLSYQRVSR